MVLSEQDVIDLAETMDPGTSAVLMVWENLWAAPFGSSVRHAGGQLVASGRIPTQAVLAALEATTRRKETEMPLGARRRRRTALAVGGAVVVAHGVNKRRDRRDDRRDDTEAHREDRRDDRGPDRR